ncbi:3' terminal RNA ribose 2'-O-methyltransferase Hen1 [Sphingosinicella sp. BN140058]|uniref:3' terminal RNA ribose 2'-O-methyltransferase Hen1 n=1 Tax=Sphingosinicella sp. BN140058 TaxID=1892855 RepID=UPI0010123CEC|nr:3' terminal RNA ribose 2'-O-methyltransferase Hen1 [Sphingosinicella sp. BN140058]QAY77260.1 3' terminal RNA ribose 2'-O-methyltransferase Hen1 [Sphingosinicella sp. BN140058]
MLLTITTTHRPATDLGFLLMKHPDNVHSVELSFGTATLFYPEATEERCTAAITLSVDPVELVRGKGRIEDQYVNDRPYAASSLLSVALARLLGTAMGGRSRHRQDLAEQPIPLEARITPLPARGAADLLASLFEPLGYAVQAEPTPLDPAHPEWGDSSYVALTLRGRVRLAALLTHLFVLVPVLDNDKHYYVGEAEVEKLLRKGAGWLETHPARELIVRRYLRGLGGLVRKARSQLDESVEAEEAEEHARRDAAEDVIEKPIRLNDQRMDRVVALIRELGAMSVLDLGCGEGRLLRELLKLPGLGRITGVEVAPRVLAGAGDRLKLDHMPDIKRRRIELLQGSLVYRDDRLKGFDAAAVIEVIEHMEAERLPAFEAAIFGHARPGAVIVTTPNRDYNALFENMAPDALRHPDHRFEWSRAEFRHWAESVALAHGYGVRFEGIGTEDPVHGCPTQLAVFTRAEDAKVAA